MSMTTVTGLIKRDFLSEFDLVRLNDSVKLETSALDQLCSSECQRRIIDPSNKNHVSMIQKLVFTNSFSIVSNILYIKVSVFGPSLFQIKNMTSVNINGQNKTLVCETNDTFEILIEWLLFVRSNQCP